MVDAVQKIVETKLFLIFARLCMVVATVVFLPLGAWIGGRLVASADQMSATLADLKLQQQLMQQSMTFAQKEGSQDRSAIRAQVLDHEGRIRVLEAERPSPNRRQ